MSKLMFSSLLFCSLIFVSLTTKPGDGVTKLGTFSYQISSDLRMQPSDKQEFLNVIKSTYGIRDINAREITLKPVPLNGKKGKNPNWIVDTKIGPLFVDKKAIHYDNKPETPKEPDSPKEPESPTTNSSFNKLNSIISKYAG
jgi:hypothetical protein